MASEMQREMETTRTELRRGILELPQETADSAAQMRRVIVDQIEALAELNRIVARHGRGMDASEQNRRGPEPAYAAAAPARHEAPRHEAPAPRQAPPPRRADITGSAPMPPPQRAVAVAQPRPGRRATAATAGCRSFCTAPRGPRPAPTSGPVPVLALVLVPRPAATTVRPATAWSRSNSLSVDIARMIDHDAAAELWDRYKRGERNVFTRRLYTMQGQKTFEEIRSKYRSDREFKQTVDRYIGEFERLLEDVSRGDRGQAMARTYLTSETGKVYTMLAHAAGRFGNE